MRWEQMVTPHRDSKKSCTMTQQPEVKIWGRQRGGRGGVQPPTAAFLIKKLNVREYRGNFDRGAHFQNTVHLFWKHWESLGILLPTRELHWSCLVKQRLNCQIILFRSSKYFDFVLSNSARCHFPCCWHEWQRWQPCDLLLVLYIFRLTSGNLRHFYILFIRLDLFVDVPSCSSSASVHSKKVGTINLSLTSSEPSVDKAKLQMWMLNPCHDTANGTRLWLKKKMSRSLFKIWNSSFTNQK